MVLSRALWWSVLFWKPTDEPVNALGGHIFPWGHQPALPLLRS